MVDRDIVKLEREIQRTKAILKQFPSNKLYNHRIFKSFKNGKYEKWFFIDRYGRHYIPKSQESYARKLAQKTYFQLLLQDLEKEKYALEHKRKYEKNSRKYLKSSKSVTNFLADFIPPSQEELHAWANEPYIKNMNYPEQLNVEVFNKIFVRSKSESFIYYRLFECQIPFRYEASLTLSNQVYYPDFTIRHPITGDTFYWEHFGIMDKKDYATNVFLKLKKYYEHDIIPGINLLTTYETLEHPLTVPTIDWMIGHYFG